MPNDVNTLPIQKVCVTQVNCEERAPNVALAFVPDERVHGFRRRVPDLTHFL